MRHWFAASIDELQLYARRENDLNVCAIRRILLACRNRKDLDRDMRRRLKKVRKAANASFASALPAFVWLRASFIVPVPGLIEEPAWERALVPEEPPGTNTPDAVEAPTSLRELVRRQQQLRAP